MASDSDPDSGFDSDPDFEPSPTVQHSSTVVHSTPIKSSPTVEPLSLVKPAPDTGMADIMSQYAVAVRDMAQQGIDIGITAQDLSNILIDESIRLTGNIRLTESDRLAMPEHDYFATRREYYDGEALEMLEEPFELFVDPSAMLEE